MLSDRMGLKHLLEHWMDPQGIADFSSRNGGSCCSNGAQKRAVSTKVFMLLPCLYVFPVENWVLAWDILFWHCYNHPSGGLKMWHFPALKGPMNDENTANCDDLPVDAMYDMSLYSSERIFHWITHVAEVCSLVEIGWNWLKIDILLFWWGHNTTIIAPMTKTKKLEQLLGS
jgi:hypothetical protein